MSGMQALTSLVDDVLHRLTLSYGRISVKSLAWHPVLKQGCRGRRRRLGDGVPCRSARCPRMLLLPQSGPAARQKHDEWMSKGEIGECHGDRTSANHDR